MSKAKSTNHKYVPCLISAAITASFGLATAAHAETKALEEVIVTAQKRDQSVQEVPIAITALTQDALQTNRVTNVVDLSGLAPNLTARPSPGGVGIASFSMRGITSYGTVPGSDKEISIYLDGVYIGSPRGSIFNLPDIAQLEVLRGPQGTLFGRNATAGAINITTRDPSGELGLRQELSAGSNKYRRTRTSIESPTWGAFSFLATYAKEERDGDIKNQGAGTVWDRSALGKGSATSPKRLGDKDNQSYFVAARFAPTDTFTMTYKLDKSTEDGTPDANAVLVVGNAASGASGAATAGILATQPKPPLIAANGRRPKEVNNAWTIPIEQTVTGHSLTTLLDVSDSVSVKNITAYRKTGLYSASELSGLGGVLLPVAPGVTVPFCIVCTQNESDSDQWSSELQVNYSTDLLELTVGALYFESEDRAGGLINGSNSKFFTAFPNHVIPVASESMSFNTAQSTALYTQLEYHLTDKVDLLAGVRETRDRKSGEYRSGFAPNKTVIPFRFDDTRPSYMLGVNYKPTFDSLIYGKYSSAFVSGGKIGTVAFDAEVAKSWEAGIKSDFLDSRLRSNLSVFYVTYNNVQTAQSGSNIGHPELSTAIADLGGEAKAKGFEWEGSASLGGGFTLNATAGYTSVYYTDVSPILLGSVQGVPAGTFGSPPGSAYFPGSNYRPTLIPKWTGSLGALYESDPLVGPAYLSLNVNGSWHSAILMEPNSARAEALPSFGKYEYLPASWVVNARAALKKIDLGPATGEIGIWGHNLTDNDYPTFALNFGGIGLSANYMEARSYGVDLIVNF